VEKATPEALPLSGAFYFGSSPIRVGRLSGRIHSANNPSHPWRKDNALAAVTVKIENNRFEVITVMVNFEVSQ
jgi:hypothetical protein